MEQIFFAIATFVSTALGGLLALRFRDRLHLFLGFTAGVILAVIAFDILPEIFDQLKESNIAIQAPMIALVAGFLLFHTIEKLIVMHTSHEGEYATHKHPRIGILSALALSGHSFMDGVGIGLGFQVNNNFGVLIAIAVISHDFADGLNTTSLMLLNHNSVKRSLGFLLLDAVAPVLGVITTNLFQFPPQFTVIYLGFFAGFLLYIAGSDILPEAHSNHPSGLTLTTTYAGVIFIFLVTQLI
ncbi:MAG TPA: ZIP family metal transporter [Chloroflexia bacterium]|nr:ZIP family metal transporter [Chloroflexia bacterium]